MQNDLLEIAWSVRVAGSKQKIGPFASREAAECEAYRLGGTEVEERYRFHSGRGTWVELAIIRAFDFGDAEDRSTHG